MRGQNLSPDRRITFKCEDMKLGKTLEILTNEEQIYFTYFSTLSSLDTKITCDFQNVPLRIALNQIFKGTNITYQFYNKNIILKEVNNRVQKEYYLKGTILDSKSKEPVSYAAIQIKNTTKGVIADQHGEFKMAVSSKNQNDTIWITSMGFESVFLSTGMLSQKGTHKIYLTPKTYPIPPLDFMGEKKVTKEIGNTGIMKWGSLYMDTHGQQTAVFIENKRRIKGILKSVNYYLSGKGNTEAPFRIRVYAIDSVTGKPGVDLLPEIVVVKPNQGRGWFKVNLTKYEIKIPVYGLFIAMEGVYPNEEYEYYNDDGFDDISDGIDTDVSNTITYGQRLGYNKNGTNITWHYSLDQEWFQIDKKNFNVMISADILTDKSRIRIFKHNNNEMDN